MILKKPLVTLIASGVAGGLLMCAAVAQAQPGYDAAAMQELMQKAQEMQACLADVDQNAMQSMVQRSQAMQGELQSLCQAGDRSGAQQHAMAFAQEVNSDPQLQKMRECGEIMKDTVAGAMQGMPNMHSMVPNIDVPDEDDLSARHICDGF